MTVVAPSPKLIDDMFSPKFSCQLNVNQQVMYTYNHMTSLKGVWGEILAPMIKLINHFDKFSGDQIHTPTLRMITGYRVCTIIVEANCLQLQYFIESIGTKLHKFLENRDNLELQLVMQAVLDSIWALDKEQLEKGINQVRVLAELQMPRNPFRNIVAVLIVQITS